MKMMNNKFVAGKATSRQMPAPQAKMEYNQTVTENRKENK